MSDATEARAGFEAWHKATRSWADEPWTFNWTEEAGYQNAVIDLMFQAWQGALASPPNGAERDALDARRYRVLRDGEWEEFDSAWLCKVDIYGQGPADLDAAIDAALTP